MKNKSLALGVSAVIAPIPLFFLTVPWSWFWAFGIGMGLLHYDTIPGWISFLSLFPLYVSPLLGVAGIIQGCKDFKQKESRAGILISLIGVLEHTLLIGCIVYLGSRF